MIYSVTFGDDFKRITKAFKNSVERNTDEELIIEEIVYETAPYGKQSHYNNLQKLRYWNKAVQEATQPLILMDTDLIVLDTIDEVWHIDKDIILTTRQDPCKYNAGVIFVRPTPIAKKMFRDWLSYSTHLFENMDNELLKIYKGLTQSSLSLLHREYADYIGEVPCQVYNLARTEHKDFNEKTKIIHIKDELRRAILENSKCKLPYHEVLRKIYMTYE